MSTKVDATIEDLYRVEGKAELVNGKILHMSPTGGLPHYAAREITVSLQHYEKATQKATRSETTPPLLSISTTQNVQPALLLADI